MKLFNKKIYQYVILHIDQRQFRVDNWGTIKQWMPDLTWKVVPDTTNIDRYNIISLTLEKIMSDKDQVLLDFLEDWD